MLLGSGVIRCAVLGVLTLNTACGDDLRLPVSDAELTALAEPRQIAIDPLPVAATPSNLPMLSWHATGILDDLTVEVVARAPRRMTDGQAALIAGVMVAGTDETVLMSGPAAPRGQLVLTLPEPVEGAWAFDVRLRDGRGRIVGWDARELIVSTTPTLRLAIDRLAATTSQPIAATISTAAGSSATSVFVIATQTGPDGIAHALPMDGTQQLISGPADNVRVPLFHQAFPFAGVYRIAVVMYDASGRPLAAARARISVCDTPTPAIVTIRDRGTPASDVPVSLFELATPDAVAQVTTDAAGIVTTMLRAGTYVAIVDTEDGGVAGEPFTIFGCGQPTAGNGDVELGGARVRKPPETATPNPFGTARSNVRLVVRASPGVSDAALSGYAAGLAKEIEELAPQIKLGSDPMLSPYVTRLTRSMTMIGDHGPERYASEQLLALSASDPTFVMDAHETGASMTVTLALVMPGEPIQRTSASLPRSDMRVDWRAMIDVLRARITPHFGLYLASKLEAPRLPILELDPLDSDHVAPGSIQIVKVTLRDADYGRMHNGKTVTLVHQGQPIDGITDDQGIASFEVAAPDLSVTTPIELSARFKKRIGPAIVSNSRFYAVAQPAQRLRAVAAPRAFAGAQMGVRVIALTDDGSPDVGAAVSLSANLGGIATRSTVVTDSAGEAVQTMTIGSNAGLGIITAADTSAPGFTALDAMSSGLGSTHYVAIDTGARITLGSSTVVIASGGAIQVDGRATLEGAPLVGATVMIAVTGSGSLSTSLATTDHAGRFSTTWMSPPIGAGSAIVRAELVVDGLLANGRRELASTDLALPTCNVSITPPFGGITVLMTAASGQFPADSLTLTAPLTVPGTLATRALSLTTTEDAPCVYGIDIDAQQAASYMYLTIDYKTSAPARVIADVNPDWGDPSCFQPYGWQPTEPTFTRLYFSASSGACWNRSHVGSGRFMTVYLVPQ